DVRLDPAPRRLGRRRPRARVPRRRESGRCPPARRAAARHRANLLRALHLPGTDAADRADDADSGATGGGLLDGDVCDGRHVLFRRRTAGSSAEGPPRRGAAARAHLVAPRCPCTHGGGENIRPGSKLASARALTRRGATPSIRIRVAIETTTTSREPRTGQSRDSSSAPLSSAVALATAEGLPSARNGQAADAAARAAASAAD